MSNLPTEYVAYEGQNAAPPRRPFPQPVRLHREILIEDLPGIFWRWKWRMLSVLLIVTAGSLLLYKYSPKQWKSEAQLQFIERINPGSSSNLYFASPVQETVDTQIMMLQSPEMFARTIGWLQNDAINRGVSPSTVTLTPQVLLKSLQVSNPKDTNLLNISVTAHSADNAVAYSNAVANAFVDWKQEMAQQDVSLAIKNLKQQEQTVGAQLAAAEEALRDYEQKAGMIDASENSTVASSDLDALRMDVNRNLANWESDDARRAKLKAQLDAINSTIARSQHVRDDSLTQSLQSQLSDALHQRQEMGEKYTYAYPGMLKPLDDRIANLRAELHAEIGRTVDTTNPSLSDQAQILQNYQQAQTDTAFALAQLQTSQAAMDAAQAKFNSVPTSSMTYNRLSRNEQLAATAFTNVEAQLTSAQLALSSVEPNVELVQPALLPDQPAWPQPLICFLALPLLGLVLGMIVAIRSEAVSHRVRDIEDLRALGIGPVVGALPRGAFHKRLSLAAAGQLTAAADAFSIARINLSSFLRQHDANGQRSHAILVTSARSGEGKSVTAASLSLSYARAGKRVVLVDANLRSPAIHRVLQMNLSPGLSEILTGTLTLADSFVISDEMPNFAVIAAGAPVASPADVVSMPSFRTLLEELKRQADVIVIDSSSCETADPLAIAPLVDCTVLVADFETADYDKIAQTAIAISSQGAPYVALMGNKFERTASKAFQFGATHPALPNPGLVALAARNGHSAPGPAHVAEHKPALATASASGGRSESDYVFGGGDPPVAGRVKPVEPVDIRADDSPASGNGYH